MKVFCCLMLLWGSLLLRPVMMPAVASSGTEGGATEDGAVEFELHECSDISLGVKFLCDPEWELRTQDGSAMIIISEDPTVTMTVAKSESPVLFLKQLTRPVLEDIGQYGPDFLVESSSLGGTPCLRVSGHSAKIPQMKLYDHYLIYDVNLYSVMFSVNPASRWSGYRTLIDKILDSFQFIGQAPDERKGP